VKGCAPCFPHRFREVAPALTTLLSGHAAKIHMRGVRTKRLGQAGRAWLRET
jgi:hypothetical protein